MIAVDTIILAIFCHFVADFILQSRKMATKKGQEFVWLLGHMGILFICFLPIGLMFSIGNTLIHGLIDWNIWKLYKFSVKIRMNRGTIPITTPQEFSYWGDYYFYLTIGFDQLLHISTIVILLNIL